MNKIAWVLVGLLAGVLIATAIPVGAHHNDLRFKKRLNRLGNQVQVLREKASALDRDGFYYGPVLGRQVVSLCPVDSPAAWTSDGNTQGIAWIHDCLDDMQQFQAREAYSIER